MSSTTFSLPAGSCAIRLLRALVTRLVRATTEVGFVHPEKLLESKRSRLSSDAVAGFAPTMVGVCGEISTTST